MKVLLIVSSHDPAIIWSSTSLTCCVCALFSHTSIQLWKKSVTLQYVCSIYISNAAVPAVHCTLVNLLFILAAAAWAACVAV